MEPLLPRPYLPHLEGGPAHLPIDAGCVHAPERRGFRDRREAGRHLARALAEYAVRSDVMVLALPCGGVPVAYEVARALGAPLDVFPEHEPCELPPPEVQGRTVILVDDGSATPAHVRAAAASLRQAHPGRIVVAIPAAAPDTLAGFSGEVDEVVCAGPRNRSTPSGCVTCGISTPRRPATRMSATCSPIPRLEQPID